MGWIKIKMLAAAVMVALAAAAAVGAALSTQRANEALTDAPPAAERTDEPMKGADRDQPKAKAAAPKPDNQAEPKDHPLEGRWRVVRATKDGEKDPDFGGNCQFIFAKAKYFMIERDGVQDGTITKVHVEPGKDGGTIDFTDVLLNPTRNGEPRSGIYQLDKGRLTLCWSTRIGGGRPNDFSADAGSDRRLVVLELSDLDKIAGEWTLVSGEIDGEAMSEQSVKEHARATFFANGRVQWIWKGDPKGDKFILKESAKPRGFEVTIASAKEERRVGIYELDGDYLKLCLGRPDDPPTAFSTKKRGSQSLYVFKRHRPPPK